MRIVVCTASWMLVVSATANAGNLLETILGIRSYSTGMMLLGSEMNTVRSQPSETPGGDR